MVFNTSLLLVLAAILHVTTSLHIPIPNRTLARKVNAARAAAMPTSTLTSDFQKNNVSAQWADGYPKQWGTEAKKYVFPIPIDSYSSFAAAVTADEKYLAIFNDTDAKIINLDTGSIISTFDLPNPGDEIYAVFRPIEGGLYDLLISTWNYTSNAQITAQIRVSTSGVPAGTQRLYSGGFGSFVNGLDVLSTDEKRMITADGTLIYVYDLDNPDSGLTLSGHVNSIMSQVFSPNGKYISSASWDGTMKLWNATTGELIQSFQTGGQNWLTRFSPDNAYVLLAIGNGQGVKPTVHIYSMNDLNAQPIIIGPDVNWIRAAEWSPDGDSLAIGGYGEILIYSISQKKIIQTWLMEDRQTWEAHDLTWLEDGKRLAYRITGGLELYDFETNLKYRWGPGDLDHYQYGSRGTFVLKNRGWIGGVDSDEKARFWQYP
jgi:WD40 repeat protein